MHRPSAAVLRGMSQNNGGYSRRDLRSAALLPLFIMLLLPGVSLASAPAAPRRRSSSEEAMEEASVVPASTTLDACRNGSNDHYACASMCFCNPTWGESRLHVTSNVTYSIAGGRGGPHTLKLDIYEPPPAEDARALRPAVVVIHGGSFATGSKNSPNPLAWCKHLASRGYVCFTINYRLYFGDPASYPETGMNGSKTPTSFLAANQIANCDLRSAVAWIRTNAAKHRVDTTRVSAFGDSAGAMTIAWSLNHDGKECNRSHEWGSISTGIQAGVSLSGASIDPYAPASERQAPYLDVHGCIDKTVP